MMHPIKEIVTQFKSGRHIGIFSVCSANPIVIEAAMQRLRNREDYLLIEATANQVDQFGGYTGMTPDGFKKYIDQLCLENDFPVKRVILGGDHLGPLTWRNIDAAQAMENAKELIRQYVLAGFTKIHIDTSMTIQGDVMARFNDELIAERAAVLCEVAEEAYEERMINHPDALHPVYVIGSEVPIPGGAVDEEEDGIQITTPQAFTQTVEAFQATFKKRDIGDAFGYVIGVVVQPGVEFSSTTVWEYDRDKAKALSESIQSYPDLVFEAHSTDYQTKEKLRELVADGFAILKVGPALTFGLREGLFALSYMEEELCLGVNRELSNFRTVLDEVMLEEPKYWEKHYVGTEGELKFERKYSFSDRCRYYLPNSKVEAAFERMMANLAEVEIPLTLISQFMPEQYKKIRENKLSMNPSDWLIDKIGTYIDDYLFAIK